MGGDDQIVYVYFNNGTHFYNAHNLTGFGSFVLVTDVTADGEWLLAVENGNSSIYKFDFTTNEFQLFQTANINA